MPLSDLHARFEHGVPNRAQVWAEGANGLAQGSYLRYFRSLDLKTAIATVTYYFGGVEYRREVFASYPDKVLAVRLSAAKPGRMSFVARMDSLLRYRTAVDGQDYVLAGKAPLQSEPNYEDRDPAIIYAGTADGPETERANKT